MGRRCRPEGSFRDGMTEWLSSRQYRAHFGQPPGGGYR